MTELHIPTLRQIAERQFQETGRISPEILDTIIEDWGIDLTPFKDPKRAKDLWRMLMTLYLIAPQVYERTCGYIEGMHAAAMAKEEGGNDIPDIVA
jgi:hypothetical protein